MLQTYGQRQRHGYVKGYPYPKSAAAGVRGATPGRPAAACPRATSTSCASSSSTSTASNMA